MSGRTPRVGMARLAVRQLRRRGGRTIGLAVAVLVAATGFTVLTASSDASRLATVGTVQAHARTAYDILARPKNAQSGLERSAGLVQPGFLTGVYGGITIAQWHRIQQIPGVQVAAPVAMVGYVYPSLRIPISLEPEWARKTDTVSRIDVTWKTDNGLSTATINPVVAYVTSAGLAVRDDAGQTGAPFYNRQGTTGAVPVCPDTSGSDPRPEKWPSWMACYSRTSGGDLIYATNQNYHGYLLTYPLAYVVAAVDPASEDALLGLDKTLVSGQPLRGAPTTYASTASGQGVPVLVANTVPTQEAATITVSDLGGDAAAHVLQGQDAGQLLRLPATSHRTETVTAQQAHAALLHDFATATPRGGYGSSRQLPGEIQAVGQVGMPTIDTHGIVQVSALRAPTASDLSRGLQYRALFSAEKVPRSITTSVRGNGNGADPATLYLRGVFDPAKLTGLSDLAAQLLAGYAPADTRAANAHSSSLLHGQALQPGVNIGGLVQPAPLMITSLAALPQLQFGDLRTTTGAAPISAIRIRVAGVTGVDDASRERVRLVAQRIQQATGLQLDVTVGSSTTARTMTLPAGAYGRPPLELSQSWLKKGVAVAVLKAVDKKSLGLFFLVLLVCGLSVTNSTLASVRSRRTELGVLATLGWTSRQILRLVALELAIIALVAGVASGLLALVLGPVLGTPVSPGRAALAIPVALLVVLVAGIIPARRAALASPMDAIRPVVARPRTTATVRSLTQMAWTNVTRVPARTILGMLGIMVGTAAVTALVAIAVAFDGAVVGTVLGDAVALQARGADYAAAGATLALAGLGVGNVLYLNIRDRAPELATLQALGWTTQSINRVLATEGALIGLFGATLGALLGAGGVWALTGTLTPASCSPPPSPP